MTLNQDEKNTIERVVTEMSKAGIFSGRYDAKHGDKKFMHGVCLVMEYLANLVNDDFGNEININFIKNMIASREKAEKSES